MYMLHFISFPFVTEKHYRKVRSVFELNKGKTQLMFEANFDILLSRVKKTPLLESP